MNFRKDFPFLKSFKGIYCQSSVAALTPKCIIDNLNLYYSKYAFSLDRDNHTLANDFNEIIEQTRFKLASDIHASEASEIVWFQSRAAIFNFLANTLPPNAHICLDINNHMDVLYPFMDLQRHRNYEITFNDYLNNPESIKTSLTENEDKTSMFFVILPALSVITGNLLDISVVSNICRNNNAKLLIDASESFLFENFKVKEQKIDYLIIDFQYSAGISGISCLYGQYDLLDQLKPKDISEKAIVTDENNSFEWKHPPESLEASYTNYSAIFALRAFLTYRAKNIQHFNVLISKLTEKIKTKIIQLSSIEKLTIITTDTLQIPIFSFTLDNIDHEEVSLLLAEEFNVFCTCGTISRSKWLSTNKYIALNHLSFSIYNTPKEIEQAIDSIIKLIELFD